MDHSKTSGPVKGSPSPLFRKTEEKSRRMMGLIKYRKPHLLPVRKKEEEIETPRCRGLRGSHLRKKNLNDYGRRLQEGLNASGEQKESSHLVY